MGLTTPQNQRGLKLVDNVLTQGRTFSGIKGYIKKQGVKIQGIYALTGKQYLT